MACAAVLEPNRDFPAWLEAQGVNEEVARAMDSELGIRDYGVLRACVGDGLVRAELLAAARDRLPFGFYAVLRQVVKALRGAETHQDGAGTPRWDDDDAAAAASSPGDVTLGGLVDVLLALFSGLSRELLLSARRLGAMDGAGTCVGGSSPGGGAEEAAMVEQHLNCTENEEIGDIAPSIIDDFGQNKMMRIIKMEEHEDGDNGGEGSVDDNDDGGGGWRAQDGADGMAASCMDGSGKSEECHSGYIIDDVTSLQGTAAPHLLRRGRPYSAIALASSQVPGETHDPEWSPAGPPYDGHLSTAGRSEPGGQGRREGPLAKRTAASAAAATSSGNRAETHWGFVIERVTSLQDAKAQGRACARRPGTVAPLPPPPPPPAPPSQKQSKPGSVKIKSEAKDWTAATIDASATVAAAVATTATTSAAAATTTTAAATTITATTTTSAAATITATTTTSTAAATTATTSAATTIRTAAAGNTSRVAAVPATIAAAAATAAAATIAPRAATHAGKRATWQLEKEREDLAPQRKLRQLQPQPQQQPHNTRSMQYKCNVCGQMFFRQFLLRKHLQKHDAERPNRCDLCGSAFRYLSDLMCHWQTHVPQTL
ncbi:sal-like protein 3 isoform X3 [Lethenteron reissneri]|uniref:sal-like protein 3 isoform X3 n=1 Tax=Lethenteron reissneri TaxID=7753 RepID=UPI002AB740CD|nr:sal-like protein 3 isoform X3 [Lethenteron reissneri]